MHRPQRRLQERALNLSRYRHRAEMLAAYGAFGLIAAIIFGTLFGTP